LNGASASADAPTATNARFDIEFIGSVVLADSG